MWSDASTGLEVMEIEDATIGYLGLRRRQTWEPSLASGEWDWYERRERCLRELLADFEVLAQE